MVQAHDGLQLDTHFLLRCSQDFGDVGVTRRQRTGEQEDRKRRRGPSVDGLYVCANELQGNPAMGSSILCLSYAIFAPSNATTRRTSACVGVTPQSADSHSKHKNDPARLRKSGKDKKTIRDIRQQSRRQFSQNETLTGGFVGPFHSQCLALENPSASIQPAAICHNSASNSQAPHLRI